MLDKTLWVTQGLLAALFLLTGLAKLLLPREKLSVRMHWAASWPRWRIKALGLAEVAGAAGLVAPGAAGILPLLTPLAAACLLALMAGAIQTHRRLGESPLPAVVVAALCAAITAGRLLVGGLPSGHP